MKISDFDYLLPPALIAQEPSLKRDLSKLLVVDRKKKIWRHCSAFADIVDILHCGDVLVLNNTRVIPAKLVGKRDTGGKVELLIIKYDRNQAQALIQAPRRPKTGEIYHFEPYCARIIGKAAQGWNLEFEGEVETVMQEKGLPPLPPYIKRKRASSEACQDYERYQTVYAKYQGSIAAPTAGLHFTSSLLERLEQKGVEILYVTLHVGIGTFLPVRCENVEEHSMEREYYQVMPEVAERINAARAAHRRIIAVGTTTCRTLETVGKSGLIVSGEGFSDLFIYPPFPFKIVEGLITNFHLPKSTLLLLISAFAGKDLIMEVYKDAIRTGYRFYSYGDAMAIL